MTLSAKTAALTGPDRAVDAEVHEALGLPFVMEYFTEHDTEPTRNLACVPRFTASLDAAMSVFLEKPDTVPSCPIRCLPAALAARGL